MSTDFQSLLRTTRPHDDDALIARISDGAAFAQAAPQDAPPTNATSVACAAAPTALREQVVTRGYARLRAVLGDTQRSTLSRRIADVRREGWPDVFAFLYADFWHALLNRNVTDAAEALCPGARLLPRSYITTVHAVGAGRGGWPPHTDAHEPVDILDGAPARATLWLALTDSTLDNGCMYVVPQPADAAPVRDVFRTPNVTAARAESLLHRARALPCAAGDALFWRPDIIHFSQPASAYATHARTAVALHLVHGAAPTSAREQPLHALDAPPFEHLERIHFVARQVLAYAAYPSEANRLNRYVSLAHRLLAMT